MYSKTLITDISIQKELEEKYPTLEEAHTAHHLRWKFSFKGKTIDVIFPKEDVPFNEDGSINFKDFHNPLLDAWNEIQK